MKLYIIVISTVSCHPESKITGRNRHERQKPAIGMNGYFLPVYIKTVTVVFICFGETAQDERRIIGGDKLAFLGIDNINAALVTVYALFGGKSRRRATGQNSDNCQKEK